MADLVSYALTTVADVKESLGIASSDTSWDNLIKRKINQATDMIEGYCRLAYDHHFKQATYTDEIYAGSGSNQVRLLMRPVTSITSFQRHDSPEFGASYSDVETNLYYKDLNSGLINLLYTQNTDWGSYRVTYVAGFSTIPSDLAEACVILAAQLVENSESNSGVKRKREGQREVEYFEAGASTGSIIEQLGLDDVLDRYVNYAL